MFQTGRMKWETGLRRKEQMRFKSGKSQGTNKLVPNRSVSRFIAKAVSKEDGNMLPPNANSA